MLTRQKVTKLLTLFLWGLLTACGGGNSDSPQPDNTPPVITLNGEAIIGHNYGDIYTDLGATVTDNVDSSVTVVTSGSVTVDMINSYTITYTATDATGNSSSIERTVNVADLAGPALTLNGDSTVTLGMGRVYKELGATALDNLDGEIIIETPSGTVDYDNLGVYELTYTATDASGNTVTAIRSVEVIAPKPFITTWKTYSGGASADNEITISTNPNFAAEYDYHVDWGDGTTDEHLTGDYIHTYDAAGIYTVTISGLFPQPYFPSGRGDYRKLITIEQWGDGILLSLHRAFASSTYLVINANDAPNLRLVTDMSYMFSGVEDFDHDITAWDVSSVTNMSGLFSGAYNTFNQDISSWDVSSVTDMSYMFGGVDNTFNQDISAWDVSSVTNMSNMFSGADAFNRDISAWDVSSVTDMKAMFYSANAFNQDISTWDVSLVTDMEAMFAHADAFNQDISTWDVSLVTNMFSMFAGANTFNQDINAWDVSSVTDMSWMFWGAEAFNQDISAWDVSSVTDMSSMFSAYSSIERICDCNFNQDISAWDVSSVTNMSDMFLGAEAFDQNLGVWNVSSVTDMYRMFFAVTLSTENYDALLKGWSSQPLQNRVNFWGGDSQYSPSSQGARDILTNTYNWYITDGGVTP